MNFKCKCGCGKEDMDQGFLDKMYLLEIKCPVPININSGFRCKKHNDATKGASKSSSHPRGHAGDVEIKNSWSRYHILNTAIQIGFKRIGVAKTFIHLDDDPKKPEEVLWTY